MSQYVYHPFQDCSKEIRLLILLPGKTNEDIKITLSHARLVQPCDQVRQENEISLKELVKTLPPGWNAVRTVENRFLFEDEKTEDTTWTHPDSKFDISQYGSRLQRPYPGFQPEYEALSYVWGSEDNPETVYVELLHGSFSPSISSTSTMQIGRNLALALRHLRYPNKTRTLWVDAICINQRDDNERNVQIRRMADIYELAQRVVVWLGPEANDSKLAISTLQHLGRQVEITSRNTRVRSPEATEPDWFHSWCKLPYTEEIWLAIHELVKRPWFERLWILQEIQLANSRAIIVCGYDTILWSRFRRTVLCLWAKKHLPSSQLREQLRLLQALSCSQRGQPFSYLLGLSRGRKCSNPRDRVYGLLGLAPPTFARKIDPQYSLPIGDTYKALCVAHINYVHRLELLQDCTLDPNQIVMPSWVPDWSMPRMTRNNANWQFASGASRSWTRYISPNTLEVLGTQCGTVCSVGKPAPHDRSDVFATIQDWEPDDLKEATYFTGESLVDVYVSSLRGNRVKERFPADSLPTVTQCKKIYVTKISKFKDASEVRDLNDLEISRVLDFSSGRSFIRLDNGYIGLAPARTQLGM